MEKWVIAVSGGPDSMALLDMMYKKSKECIVAHVNYHKRDTSNRDQKIIEDYCIERSIPFEILEDNKQIEFGNFQAYARELRYSFFKKVVDKYKAKGIMTGHHRDDDIETYIFQKERRMLSNHVGISETTYINDLLVYRPLLSYSKNDLINYCNENFVPYGFDETNEDDKYTRNRIRKNLKDLNELQIASLLKEMKFKREEQNQKYLEQFNSLSQLGNVISPKALLDPIMLRAWLLQNGVPIFHLSVDGISEIYRQFSSGKGTYQWGEYMVYAQYGKIHIDKMIKTYHVMKSLQYGSIGNVEFSKSGKQIEAVNLSQEDFPIIIRNPKPGDKIELRIGTKSINRHFIDRKIPLGKRKNTVVIENSRGEIVFVVGIGCDIHHYSNNSNLFVIEL